MWHFRRRLCIQEEYPHTHRRAILEDVSFASSASADNGIFLGMRFFTSLLAFSCLVCFERLPLSVGAVPINYERSLKRTESVDPHAFSIIGYFKLRIQHLLFLFSFILVIRFCRPHFLNRRVGRFVDAYDCYHLLSMPSTRLLKPDVVRY
jgi:hypothetical protein